jgi:hypothetical protein
MVLFRKTPVDELHATLHTPQVTTT